MIAEVIIDVNAFELDRIFDYVTIDGAREGSRVIVPFANRKTEGFIIALKEKSDVPAEKLKKIIRVVEEIPALTEECLSLAKYVADKYHTSMALSLRLFLPSEMRKGKVRHKTVAFLSVADGIDGEKVLDGFKASAQNQKAAFLFVLKNGRVKRSEAAAEFSQSSVSALIKKGFLTVKEERVTRLPYKEAEVSDKTVELTEEQKSVINSIENSTKPTLIFGVTGSGKTEVYMRLIKSTVEKGKTAIMLVPEIALTPQTLSRLRGRFGSMCAILHSGLSAGEKFDEWWRLRSGEAKIAIGARSAIFAPIADIGLIIIDEEHEQSYESESAPRYETDKIALRRAEYNGAKLVLGSATPKIESFAAAKDGRYDLAIMRHRVSDREMPEMIVADMREEVRSGNPSAFSSALKTELENTLKSGNQAMIFLNRRGYSHKIICRECGYVAKCDNCDVSLTYHRYENLLKCHYCGARYKMPSGCPECGSTNINYSGTGTQKVVDDLKELFPSARILRMDNDTTQNKEAHFRILKEFADKKADILVGTQMIAKGHDFGGVTLVGILDADMSLYFSDYRAGERTFQLITQVAGRSGRAERKGKAVLQTFSPQNTVLRFAARYDYEGFYNYESAIRKAAGFPPYSDILRIMVESDDDKKGMETLKNVFFACREVYNEHRGDFAYFDKMKSPVKRIKNKFRYQVLARVLTDRETIERKFYEIADGNTSRNAFCYLEINPSSMS